MRILILGCGRIGSGLAQRLSLAGASVTVIEPSATALARLSLTFVGRTLHGDVLDRQLLRSAEIERQDALAAVMPSDDTNIVAARLARHVFKVPRVVARLYSPTAAVIYQRLGIQTVCTTTWGINRMVELLSYSELEPVASLGDHIDVMEMRLPPLLVGRPVSALARPGEILVAAISRGGTTFLPQAETRFEADDLLHLVVHATATERLGALLHT
jgi:trk system potassium uptake protein